MSADDEATDATTVAEPPTVHWPDPVRRAAILATAITVPVLVAAVIAVNVWSGPRGDDSATERTPASPRPDEVIDVATPPLTAEAESLCPALMERMPLKLVGDASRRVSASLPFVYAWGEPPTILVCGVEPVVYPPDAFLPYINSVNWYVDTSDPSTAVWTTIDRPVAVQLRIPTEVDGAAAAALGPVIDEALPLVG